LSVPVEAFSVSLSAGVSLQIVYESTPALEISYTKAGGVLKPVYFSSTVVDGEAQQLDKCVPKFGYGFAAEVLRAASGFWPNISYQKRALCALT